jgi:hypothetical protein
MRGFRSLEPIAIQIFRLNISDEFTNQDTTGADNHGEIAFGVSSRLSKWS